MVLEHGLLRFEADFLTAKWEEDELVMVTATGHPAKFVRNADPKRGSSEATASAQNIVYKIRDEQVEFREQAVFLQEGASISGYAITFNLASQELLVDSQAERQAEIIYYPDPK